MPWQLSSRPMSSGCIPGESLNLVEMKKVGREKPFYVVVTTVLGTLPELERLGGCALQEDSYALLTSCGAPLSVRLMRRASGAGIDAQSHGSLQAVAFQAGKQVPFAIRVGERMVQADPRALISHCSWRPHPQPLTHCACMLACRCWWCRLFNETRTARIPSQSSRTWYVGIYRKHGFKTTLSFPLTQQKAACHLRLPRMHTVAPCLSAFAQLPCECTIWFH